MFLFAFPSRSAVILRFTFQKMHDRNITRVLFEISYSVRQWKNLETRIWIDEVYHKVGSFQTRHIVANIMRVSHCVFKRLRKVIWHKNRQTTDNILWPQVLMVHQHAASLFTDNTWQMLLCNKTDLSIRFIMHCKLIIQIWLTIYAGNIT